MPEGRLSLLLRISGPGTNFRELRFPQNWSPGQKMVYSELKRPSWLRIWPWIGPKVASTCTVVYRLTSLKNTRFIRALARRGGSRKRPPFIFYPISIMFKSGQIVWTLSATHFNVSRQVPWGYPLGAHRVSPGYPQVSPGSPWGSPRVSQGYPWDEDLPHTTWATLQSI